MKGKMRVWAVSVSSGIFFLVVGALILTYGKESNGMTDEAIQIKLEKVAEDWVKFDFRSLPPKKKKLQMVITDLDGEIVGQETMYYSGMETQVRVKARLDKANLAKYTLAYRLGDETEYQRKSLFYLVDKLETILLGQREFLKGGTGSLRVIVRNRSQESPIVGAAVNISMQVKDGREIELYRGMTDPCGTIEALFTVPLIKETEATLKTTVETNIGADKVEESIKLKRGSRLMLTTDKPLYQPGQSMYLRVLAIDLATSKPVGEEEIVFEVEDSKGNKVFKNKKELNNFGVAWAEFVLADELNMGRYNVRALLGSEKQEKTVTIERYVLPKFKVDFTTQRHFYAPGEMLKGEVQADYFFGKPVSGAEVKIELSKFDVGFDRFATIEGTTDEAGHYTFEEKLPDYFVGQPLEQGKAFVKADVSVRDTAEHKEKTTRNITISRNPVYAVAVPESGDLIPDIENIIYIVTTYPDGTPVQSSMTVKAIIGERKESSQVETDQGGFGRFVLVPTPASNVRLEIKGKDNQGNKFETELELKVKEKETDMVLLRSDNSIYKVGQKAVLSLISTKKSGTAYFDVIRQGQTVLTKTGKLKNGLCQIEIDWTPSLTGTVGVNGYIISADGNIIRDKKLLIVEPASDLKIGIETDKTVYLPGEEAELHFKVADSEGRPVLSALGFMIVDESVFALQEMQPGMEKVYFYLEQELLKPRYEIHGYDMEKVVILPPEPRLEKAQNREKAARVLLAAAEGIGQYDIKVNTYERERRGEGYQEYISQYLMKKYEKIEQALEKFSQRIKRDEEAYYNRIGWSPDQKFSLQILVDERLLGMKDIKDPWGNVFKFEGTLCKGCRVFHSFRLHSAGPDGKAGTADDIVLPDISFRGEMPGRQFLMGGDWGGDIKMMMAAPMILHEEMLLAEQEISETTGGEDKGAAAAPPEAPRVRKYFPETLHFEPSLITDEDGRALKKIKLADSITTWRLTGMASSLNGALGSRTFPLKVFQDFFIDIDFPIALIQDDEVSVPVAVYNYLKEDQKISLKVEEGDWFDLLDEAEKEVMMKPGEVGVVYFTVKVRKIGHHKFTVYGMGSQKSDAISRVIRVEPNGEEQVINYTGRLEKNISADVNFPKEAISEASKIFVKIYPGVFAQVLEGMDKIFRMPFGCFEQTSSVTYPNILVLDYMKSTDRITPEIQMKAEGFINLGYQRLLSYEVPGGGFEWFGNPPAHKILTAYGLMQFYDMSEVHEIDPAIIDRTQKWLVSQQEKDGSWKPSQAGIQEGAIDKFTDDVVRNTAYVTWALAVSENRGEAVAKGINYLKKELAGINDNYTLALAANTFVSCDPDIEETERIIKKLVNQRTEEGELVYWKTEEATPTFGRGKCAEIETTALACQVLLKYGRHHGLISRITDYLVKSKDSYGTWESTQATIQALRALIMSIKESTRQVEADVTVKLNDKEITKIRIDESNNDLLQIIDFGEKTSPEANKVELVLEGEGSMFYQVVGRYYVPYQDKPHGEEPMTIEVDYDRTELKENDILSAAARVKNNRNKTARMVIVDLGLPPGFDLMSEDFKDMVDKKTIEKYSTTGRQVIVYLSEVKPEAPVTLKYRMKARFPIKAKSPASRVYEYYNPSIKGESGTQEIIVHKSH